MQAFRFERLGFLAYRLPEQGGKQEGRRDRQLLLHARVGAGQRLGDERDGETLILDGQRRLSARKQLGEQAMMTQGLESLLAETVQEELEDLLEQACRGHIRQEAAEPADGGL